MAIVKLTELQPSTPGAGGWDNIVAYQSAFMRQINSGQRIVDGAVIKEGSYIQHGGVIYQVQSEDYTILGSLTAGVFNYIKIEVSGSNLIATWITNISSYNWNYIYSELLASDESGVLPYTERDSVVYKLDQKKILSNQELLTDSDVEFGRLKIKNTDDVSPTSTDNPLQVGENNAQNLAFDTNQILCRDGIGGLSNLLLNVDGSTKGFVWLGEILPLSNPTSGSQTLAGGEEWIFPRGVYMTSNNGVLSVDGGSSYSNFYGGTIFADGLKVRIKFGTTTTLKYLKF